MSKKRIVFEEPESPDSTDITELRSKRRPVQKKSKSQKLSGLPLTQLDKPPKNTYQRPVWEFPKCVDDPFDLEPDFWALQKEFSLSNLVNGMSK